MAALTDVAYPAWLYCRTGEAKLVRSAEQADALGPDWADSPAAWQAPAPPVAPEASTVGTSTSGVAVAPAPSTDVAGQKHDAPDEASALHATVVGTLVAQVQTISNPDLLVRAAAFEQTNPKGPRKAVLRAITKRLRQLAQSG